MSGFEVLGLLESIEKAQTAVYEHAIRTPLIRYQGPSAAEIYLKLESMQPIGSFKIRGASNAIQCINPNRISNGVLVASTGNMAQGVAYIADKMAIPCTVIVPDNVSEAKIVAIQAYGAKCLKVPLDQWWETLVTRHFLGQEGTFIHPVADIEVIAGNSSIGVEILEQMPDVDTIITPFGGGGLTSGVSAACQYLNSHAQVKACEVYGAAPLYAALQAGQPIDIDYQTSFVDGIGSRSVLEEMWPLLSRLVFNSLRVTSDKIKQSIVWLARYANIVAEGAAAASLAAALQYGQPGERIVCVITGGNISLDVLADIFKKCDAQL